MYDTCGFSIIIFFAMFHLVTVVAFSFLLSSALADKTKLPPFKNPNYVPGRDVMVHLFEWKWNDIADECETFLGPMGFAGVQTSPVTENMVIPSRTWSERYQPISYNWITRSGNEQEIKNMVRRCNHVGVRIYVDLVLNHMTEDKEQAVGIGGSIADPKSRDYPAVPYNPADFHLPCEIDDWWNITQLRNCRVHGHDLDQAKLNVRRKIISLMNKLIDAGVAGFRIDAAKHMWPDDLRHIYSHLKRLNIIHNFTENSRPYVYQDVGNYHNEGLYRHQYKALAASTEYLYGLKISEALQGRESFNFFSNLHEHDFFMPSEDALVFIDNHETQRSIITDILTYKSSKLYKMAVALMLAHTYGNPRVMSSYDFNDFLAGPPSDDEANIISPKTTYDGSCEGGWICEHRWRQIYNMVAFRRTVSGTIMEDWWEDNNQMAFSRGDRGFIAINGGHENFVALIPTKLPPGIYCDVISGELINGTCSGKFVHVYSTGKVYVTIKSDEEDGVIAIHRNAMLPDVSRMTNKKESMKYFMLNSGRM